MAGANSWTWILPKVTPFFLIFFFGDSWYIVIRFFWGKMMDERNDKGCCYKTRELDSSCDLPYIM